jgi:DNA-binding transcriptional LysR family regulator
MRDTVSIGHLRAFVEVAERRSIQAAARESGRSRATYMRVLAEIAEAFGAPELLQRAPGQRLGVLTPQGQELARRARAMLEQWERWQVATRDALAQASDRLRVGALPGSFDLIADLLDELRSKRPALALHVVEYPDDRLLQGVVAGEVDLGFGTQSLERPAGERAPSTPRLRFESFGPLPWVVIASRRSARALPSPLRLRDLDGVPLVVQRSGAARETLEHYFAEYEGGPLVLHAAFEVGSTPRLVEMVARGFGPALVSRFRVGFVPRHVVALPLLDGPAPLVAGVFVRRGAVLPDAARTLIDRARKRFAELG